MQTSSESSDETSHLHGPCCSFASPRPLAFDWRGGVGTEVYAIPQTLPLFEWWEVPAVGLIWVLWVHGKDQRCVSQRVGATLWSKVGLSLAVGAICGSSDSFLDPNCWNVVQLESNHRHLCLVQQKPCLYTHIMPQIRIHWITLVGSPKQDVDILGLMCCFGGGKRQAGKTLELMPEWRFQWDRVNHG